MFKCSSKIWLLLIIMAAALPACGGTAPKETPAVTKDVAPAPPQSILFATTTSTYDTGLLDYLNPIFTRKTGIEVKVVSMGTGAAFETAKKGDADLILVHDREGELKFVSEGWGVDRRDVMYNDFIILGPAANPAGITKDEKPEGALRKIMETSSIFISRGDDSGTNRKELKLWDAAGLKDKLAGNQWYKSIGQGMGAALRMADEMDAYVLTDRGTYLTLGKNLKLVVLNEKDKSLRNDYGIIAVNPDKYPDVKYNLAMKYIDWITSGEGQSAIASFKVDGEQLFFPVSSDAGTGQVE